jgi:hypothetical protein
MAMSRLNTRGSGVGVSIGIAVLVGVEVGDAEGV